MTEDSLDKDKIVIKRKKIVRSLRPIQLSNYVHKITKTRLDLMKERENSKQNTLIEKAIKLYQQTYHPDLVITDPEWNLLEK